MFAVTPNDKQQQQQQQQQKQKVRLLLFAHGVNGLKKKKHRKNFL